MVAPLTDLLKAKSKLLWSASCQQAFVTLKLCCVLFSYSAVFFFFHPRLDQPFKLHMNARYIRAGVVLIQA